MSGLHDASVSLAMLTVKYEKEKEYEKGLNYLIPCIRVVLIESVISFVPNDRNLSNLRKKFIRLTPVCAVHLTYVVRKRVVE
jgi:hypothetical protein